MSNNIPLFFLLFGRLLGFFLLSPFFSRLGFFIRFSLSLAFTLAIFPSLFQIPSPPFTHPLSFFLLLTKEVLVGYLLGFVFSLLFEAAAFAGQVITTLGGFSAVEIFDSPSHGRSPLFSPLFSLTTLILFLALDLHHFVLHLIHESFSFLPLGTFVLQGDTVLGILHAMDKMFHYALSYALYPLTILLGVTLLLAIFSRELMIFLNGLPIQIFVTFCVVAFSISSFDKILIENFSEFFSLVKKVLFPL